MEFSSEVPDENVKLEMVWFRAQDASGCLAAAGKTTQISELTGPEALEFPSLDASQVCVRHL